MTVFRRSGGAVALTFSKSIPTKAGALVEKLEPHRFQGIEGAEHEAVSCGWATPADPSGQHFDPAAIDVEGALWLVMRIDAKKVPTAIVANHTATAEASMGRPLSRSERRELRQDLEPKLLAKTLPSTKSVDVLMFPGDRLLLLFTTSNAALESFVKLWRDTFGDPVVVMFPVDLARHAVAPVRALGALLDDLTPTKLPVKGQRSLGLEPVEEFLGAEFLLWLWFRAEEHDGSLELKKPKGQAGVIVTDLVELAPNDSELTVTTLRGGLPTRTPEATSCLRRGYRPARLRLFIGFGSASWEVTVDAERFAFSGTVLPEEDDDLTGEERSAHRVEAWHDLFAVFSGVFGEFLAVRLSPDGWERESSELIAWMENRP